MNIKSLQTVDIANKRVLIREDLNVPLENGNITSDIRIQAALPTLQYALEKHAAVMVMSHLGRPKENEFDPQFSLKPIAVRLSELLEKPVRFIRNWLEGVEIKAGEIVLLENVRFNVGEEKNDKVLAKKMASLCDVFVMDAFATAHRAQASTEGITHFVKEACAGPLLMSELDALSKALDHPKKPLVAIVGGSKVSTKLTVLESLLEKVDQLIVGGGIANTFIAALGFKVGKSLYEADYVDTAKGLMQKAKAGNAEILIPEDVAVATEFNKTAKAMVKAIDQVLENELILDIGPKTIKQFSVLLQKAGTIVWNGPVGVFEWEQFGYGTETLAHAIATSPAFSIAGGGDTLAAIDKYNISSQISYISTGGGAFLEFLEGKSLPAVAALMNF